MSSADYCLQNYAMANKTTLTWAPTAVPGAVVPVGPDTEKTPPLQTE